MKKNLKSLLMQNMLVRQVLRPVKYLKDTVVGVFVYFQYSTVPAVAPEKSVYLDIKDNVYNRYLYLFLKFFAIEGYTIYLKANPVTLRYIYHFHQSRLILHEKMAHFVMGRERGCQVNISDSGQTNRLSADYFTKLLQGQPAPQDFYVPMAMHPLMYHQGLWNKEFAAPPRIKSVFFAGNFDRSHYDLPADQDVFNMVNRIRIQDLLQEKASVYFPKSLAELRERTEENEVVMVVKKNFLVPMAQLRPTLARYSFFLACPGYIMPFSHNVIEAMSVGTVPIIQASYAALFQPALEHGKNAFFFENEADLLDTIQQALQLEPSTLAFLFQNVIKYYNDNLTPRSVVQRLREGSFQNIFLNAELPSVNLVKENFKKQEKLSGAEVIVHAYLLGAFTQVTEDQALLWGGRVSSLLKLDGSAQEMVAEAVAQGSLMI